MEDTVAGENIKKYEIMVIINPNLGADALKKRLDEIRKLLTGQKGERSGKVFFEDDWGLRDLTYVIKKHDRGYYAVFDFMMDPALINEVDTTLRLENEILRHMIITLPFAYEPKSFAKIEEEKEEEKKEEKKPGRFAPPKKAVVRKEEVEPKAAMPADTLSEEAPKKKTTLEDVDAKLKSIIDNPDINF